MEKESRPSSHKSGIATFVDWTPGLTIEKCHYGIDNPVATPNFKSKQGRKNHKLLWERSPGQTRGEQALALGRGQNGGYTTIKTLTQTIDTEKLMTDLDEGWKFKMDPKSEEKAITKTFIIGQKIKSKPSYASDKDISEKKNDKPKGKKNKKGTTFKGGGKTTTMLHVYLPTGEECSSDEDYTNESCGTREKSYRFQYVHGDISLL